MSGTTRRQGSLGGDLSEMMEDLTRGWKREKKHTDKTNRLRTHQFSRLYEYSSRVTLREVAFEVMEQAYLQASANGKYHANARQIFYAARPAILERATKERLNSQYFTQTLLKDYLEEYDPDWKVVWDARGHFQEPHTGVAIGVGGANVSHYIRSWRLHATVALEVPVLPTNILTKGPRNRFKTVLFIEKEGFNELLADARIAEKYDMAIMSTKGVPVKAACDLLWHMEDDVTIYVLHDFDVSGFKILKTLRTGTRLAQGVEVVDLGFRLEDITGLPSEPFNEKAKAGYLRRCGCTPEEIEFLQTGQRVELNAMMSDQFVAWLEDKLRQHGVEKIIPGSDMLESAYQRACFAIHTEKELARLKAEAHEVEIPTDLAKRVRRCLLQRPELSWDQALRGIANARQRSDQTLVDNERDDDLLGRSDSHGSDHVRT